MSYTSNRNLKNHHHLYFIFKLATPSPPFSLVLDFRIYNNVCTLYIMFELCISLRDEEKLAVYLPKFEVLFERT